MRRILALAVLSLAVSALVSCAGGGVHLPNPKSGTAGDALSFAQVQSIQPGLTAEQLVDAFGEPRGQSRRSDGSIERMEYAALDAKDGKHSLVLEFDGRNVLRQKTFTGAILKP